MNKQIITIKKSSDGSVGNWKASVAKGYAPKGAKSSVALGESEIYQTKDEAWASIQKRVEKLDYENDDIIFNQDKVSSYEEVQQKVALL